MGSRINGRSRRNRRGLASFVSFLLLFAFALGQSSSLVALADDAGTDAVSTEGVVSDGPSTDGTLPAEEAPAEEAPAEEAPAEEAPVVEEGTDETEASSDAAAPAPRSAPKSSQLKTPKTDSDAGILSHGGLHGGDVNLDFVAAGPFTYDHDTGLGDRPEFGYDNRTISKTNGVVESLEGGDFACDDLVTFFVEIEIEDGAGSGSVALDLSFGAETTGQPGLGFDDIVSYGINEPDDGNVGLDGDETVTLSNEHLDTAGYDDVKGTFTVSNLEGGETAILRVTVHLACEVGASPTGNILNAIEAARVVGGERINIGQETVPMKQVGGIQAVPAISVTKDCPASVPFGDLIQYDITVSNEGNEALVGVTVDDSLLGDITSEFDFDFADPFPVGGIATATILFDPGNTDPVLNTVTVEATGDISEVAVSDEASCETDITHVPGISVVKDCPVSAAFGADVTFTITITNTGNEPLTDVAVNDDLLGGDITAAFNLPDPLPVGTTAYSAEFSYTPGADEDPVENSVDVSAVGTDSEVTATAADACETDVSNPAIQIVKTVSEEIVPVGTTVTYTYVVTNIGDVTLYDVAVTDDIMGLIGTIPVLEVGPEFAVTLTKDFQVGNEPVLNVGTARGHDILGRFVSDDDDAFVSPILGTNPPNPPNPPNNPPTPFTGSDAGRLGIITILLFGIGVTVVASTRRRRPEREAA
jgi:hypothetical protein